MSGVYLYAVAGEVPARLGRGLAGERLRAVSAAGVHAIVGAIAQPPTLDRAHLEAHDAVVRSLARRTPALLPARFGSVVDSDAVAGLLRARAARLRRALRTVRGCEQMTLRVFGPGPARPATAVPAPAGSGAAFLARRSEEARARRTVPEIRALRARLKELVRGERVERHAIPPLIASVYHLLPRGSATRYRALVRSAAAALAPVRVTVSGPWAPYAFAPEDLG